MWSSRLWGRISQTNTSARALSACVGVYVYRKERRIAHTPSVDSNIWRATVKIAIVLLLLLLPRCRGVKGSKPITPGAVRIAAGAD